MGQNTVIVYAGDNGYFWGEHRFVDKRWAYEEAIRIPFIVRYPDLINRPGQPASIPEKFKSLQAFNILRYLTSS
jgi:arylsulfatase A-like enzyme